MTNDNNEKVIYSELRDYYKENYEDINGIDKGYFIKQFGKYFKKNFEEIDGEYNVKSYTEDFLDKMQKEEEEKYNEYC